MTNQAWSINNLSCIWSKRELFLRDQSGKSRAGARWALLARSVSRSKHMILFILPDRRFSHMINIDSILLLLHVKQFQLKYCKNNSRELYNWEFIKSFAFKQMSDNHTTMNHKSFFFFRNKLGFINGEARPNSPLLPLPRSHLFAACSQLCYW